MQSQFSDRHRRSMNTLSIHRPRPSMEIRTPTSSNTAVKRGLVILIEIYVNQKAALGRW